MINKMKSEIAAPKKINILKKNMGLSAIKDKSISTGTK
jgi:hypothetical protein